MIHVPANTSFAVLFVNAKSLPNRAVRGTRDFQESNAVKGTIIPAGILFVGRCIYRSMDHAIQDLRNIHMNLLIGLSQDCSISFEYFQGVISAQILQSVDPCGSPFKILAVYHFEPGTPLADQGVRVWGSRRARDRTCLSLNC